MSDTKKTTAPAGEAPEKKPAKKAAATSEGAPVKKTVKKAAAASEGMPVRKPAKKAAAASEGAPVKKTAKKAAAKQAGQAVKKTVKKAGSKTGSKSAKGKKRRKKQKNGDGMKLLAVAVALAAVALIIWFVSGGATRLTGGVTDTVSASLSPTEAPTATPEPTPLPTTPLTPVPTATPAPTPVVITLSACGDCTIGGDMKGSSEQLFYNTMLDENGQLDYGYPFRNVREIFEADDVTIANLEVVLTDSDNYLVREDKQFIMRGRPEYVNMLTGSSIEVCNIANNHITDFGEWGVKHMADFLVENGIGRCGYGYSYIAEVKGVRMGFVGFNYWTTKEAEFRQQLTDMRAQCDIMIVSIHWGNELEYYPLPYQQEWGHIAVDLGADLVIGHHPHVIEGIECYNGVNIVYSLGNFCFGGKKNPTDKDTFIYQHTFTVDPDSHRIVANDFTIIPCKITSVPNDEYNNYQPTPIADPDDQIRVLRRIEEFSRKLKYPLDLVD